VKTVGYSLAFNFIEGAYWVGFRLARLYQKPKNLALDLAGSP
jgi:hypothetical protein